MPSQNSLVRKSLNAKCLSSLHASQNQPVKKVKVPQVGPRQVAAVKVGGTPAVVVVVDAVVPEVAEQDVVDVL